MNVAFVKEHPVTAGSMAMVVVLFLAGLVAREAMGERVSLVLANTVGMNFYLWNFFTAGFYETNILKVLFDLAWLASAGRMMEESMGTEGFAIFWAVVNGLNGLVTSVALFSLFVITRMETVLFMQTYGFGGLIGALAVGLKLIMPRETPIPTIPSLKCHHLPMLLGLISMFCWTLNIQAFAKDTPFVVIGIYASWWYLRFVHKGPDGLVGNVSEDFAFITLFPPACRRYLSPFAEFTYGVALLLGYFKERRPAQAGMSSPEDTSLVPPSLLPQVHDPVAERRRAKAREQLDAKLAAMAAQDDEKWDDEEE